MSNKYFPNKWKLVKNLPDEIFTELALPFDEFMEWRVDSWVLPEGIEVLIRATNMVTHQVKEYVYKRPEYARRKVRELVKTEQHEITVCTQEAVIHIPLNLI
jgi:hypothetical protein